MFTVVTGAQGFLGRHMVMRLAREGHKVLAVDRRAAAPMGHPNIQVHFSDLADPTTLIPPDCEPVGRFALIHLAWDLRSRETSFKIQSEQVTGLAGLLDAWKDRGLAYVMAPGSAQEFGQRSGEIGDEDLPVGPLSPYGWAKHAMLDMVSSWGRQSGVGVLWLRPFIAYGPGQGGSMFVPYAVRQAQMKEQADVTDCEQIRDFVYVDDVVEAFVLGLRKQPAGVHQVNLGSKDPARLRDVLTVVADHFGAGEIFRFGAKPRRMQDPDVQVARVDRAKDLLGWTPKTGWREGIRRVCEEAGRV